MTRQSRRSCPGRSTITLTVGGFLTLWVKLKYGIKEASDAARAAVTEATVVREKLEDNTNITEAVNAKADIVVKQTNGALEATQGLVKQLVERVGKLEDYNRDSTHRTSDAIQAST